MENVDGAALHYELQKEHPYWKLHVSRFNALGKEFYHEHFRQDTIHTEAMGLTRYVRGALLDALSMDYVRTARAKGLREKMCIRDSSSIPA